MTHHPPVDIPLLNVTAISKKLSAAFTLGEIGFSQSAGEKLCLTGETGSGKSSLLRIIAGLLQPDAGNAFLHGERIKGPDEKLLPGHSKIAYLPQDHELRNNYRMEELLAYANRLDPEHAQQIYRLCRIDHLFSRKNDQLSGGEKQRVALARLLVSDPQLLLLDEPFSNLDLIHKNILKNVIRDISLQLNTSCILSSHDPTDTLSWADRVLVMKKGTLVQQGTPENIYLQPVNEYVAALFGSYNLMNASVAHLFGIDIPSNSQLLVRPEMFRLADRGNVKAEIIEIFFKGPYHELIVRVNETILHVISNRTLSVGDLVYLSLPKNNYHLLPA